MMKQVYKNIIVSALLGILIFGYQDVKAGNKDRAGEAGASQLLINPWARSNGLGGANSAYVRGLEAQFLNVAGIAHTKKTEIIFAHSTYLVGTGTSIEAFGLTKRVGESGGVFALSLISINFGDIDITTVDSPEGGLGSFSPRNMNINLSYARAFTSSITGGFNLKILSEQISNVSAGGIAIDAGIQYVTGKRDQIKFGVALKNVGPNLQFSGDGLTFRGYVTGSTNTLTLSQRSASLELPSLLRIGFSYDIYLNDDHKFIPSYTFTANSFTPDEHTVGLEYIWGKYLALRGGYVLDESIWGNEIKMSAYSGIKGGLSLMVPTGKGESKGSFSIDYAYQTTNPFAGTHTIGVRIDM
jgi:hypothetical protein